MQLYGDCPHRWPPTRFHPVSGSIAGRHVFARETSEAFSHDAASYLSACESKLTAMVKGVCRLGFVSELPIIPDYVAPDHCLDLGQLVNLITTKPMLVPFRNECLCMVRELGMWATKELQDLHSNFTGNVAATWRAYQLELSLEKLLWGQPLLFRSSIYSVNLGPGKLALS